MSTLDQFKRGRVAPDVRLHAAQGGLAVPATELLSILVLLLGDDDVEVRTAAETTLSRLPSESVQAFLVTADVSDEVRQHFLARFTAPPSPDAVAGEPGDKELPPEVVDETADRESLLQKLGKMSFSERVKAASKGSREARAILIRDPSKMIAMAVLTSPKLTEPEVASFARMGNVSEDVLRTIGSNRSWMKNYGVLVALTKNAKTPLALSLNLMHRLNDRDLAALSTDRNVPEPLRVAARKKVVSAVSR